MTTLTIFEETMRGERIPMHMLEFLTERVTAQELIRRYVYEQVQEANRREEERVRTQETGHETERLLNGARPGIPARRVDWETQAARACEAFRRNRFFLLVDDKQIRSLEAEIVLRPETQISFLRLIPLAGG